MRGKVFDYYFNITISISQTENWDWPKDFSTNMIIYCLKVGSAWSQFSDNSRPREDTEQLNQFAKEIWKFV